MVPTKSLQEVPQLGNSTFGQLPHTIIEVFAACKLLASRISPLDPSPTQVQALNSKSNVVGDVVTGELNINCQF